MRRKKSSANKYNKGYQATHQSAMKILPSTWDINIMLTLDSSFIPLSSAQPQMVWPFKFQV